MQPREVMYRPADKNLAIPVMRMQELNESSRSNSANALANALRNHPGSILIEEMRVDDGNLDLLWTADLLGTAITEGVTIPGHPLEPGGVYLVEPVNQGNGISDEDGLLIFSTTSQIFEGHTDGYHNLRPPDYVLLLCVRPDRGVFGQTSIVDIRDVIPRIDPGIIDLLRETRFPSSSGPIPIIAGPADAPTVRFNLKEILRFCKSGAPLSDIHMQAALLLQDAIDTPTAVRHHSLKSGECLITDNMRVLHGRSPLSEGSARLLKRVWVRRANAS